MSNSASLMMSAISGAFYLTAIASIGLLMLIAFAALNNGPLQEAGMVFVHFFTIYFLLSPIGAILGILVRIVRNRWR